MHQPIRANSSSFTRWRPAEGLIRRIYTGNPFYILSADLVFVGLRMSFEPYGETFEVGALLFTLLGYTLLLATTAWILIRYGHVWDDARTLLLLVVAMFLAISMTFDETLALNPRLGVACCTAGLIFAIVVSEGLLWGIRLRLPALYRIPYYLILSLFYLYPVTVSRLLRDPDDVALRWALFSFSPIAGVAFLSLIPAIRKGAAYVSKNGSPWRYPLYPWSLFGLLAAAVCIRAFCLCLSLHFPSRSANFSGRSDTIFAPYFLVPFLLTLDLLILEFGLVARSRCVQKTAILLLPAIAALAISGYKPDPVFRGFLELFITTTGGSPLFLSLIAMACFAAYAAARGVPFALGGMAFALLSLTLVGPRTIGIIDFVPPRSTPLLALGCLQIWLGIRMRTSWRCATGFACVFAAAWIAFPASNGPGIGRSFAMIHLAVVAAALIGASIDDSFSRQLRRLSAISLLLLSIAAESMRRGGVDFLGIPAGLVPIYSLTLLTACAGWGIFTASRLHMVVASIGLSVSLISRGSQVYGNLRRHLVGMDWIVLGLTFFVVAALISLGKVETVRRRFLDTCNDRADESLNAL